MTKEHHKQSFDKWPHETVDAAQTHSSACCQWTGFFSDTVEQPKSNILCSDKNTVTNDQPVMTISTHTVLLAELLTVPTLSVVLVTVTSVTPTPLSADVSSTDLLLSANRAVHHDREGNICTCVDCVIKCLHLLSCVKTCYVFIPITVCVHLL